MSRSIVDVLCTSCPPQASTANFTPLSRERGQFLPIWDGDLIPLVVEDVEVLWRPRCGDPIRAGIAMCARQTRHQDDDRHPQPTGHLDRVVDNLILLLARGGMELISVGGQCAERQPARRDLADEFGARLL